MRGRLTCELGRVLDAAGRLEEALELHRQAVRMLEGGVDDGRVEADDLVLVYAHNRLGHVLNCADDAPAAVEAQRRALAVLHRAGRDDLLPAVLIDLGYTFWGAGRLDAAKDALSSGRQLLERQGRRGERDWAHATAGLGMVEQDAGHLDEAVTHQRVAISAFSHVVAAMPDSVRPAASRRKALRNGLRIRRSRAWVAAGWSLPAKPACPSSATGQSVRLPWEADRSRNETRCDEMALLTHV